MKKEILLLTGRNKFFGQTRKPWVSIDTDLLIEKLQEYGFTVNAMEFDDIVNSTEIISNSIVFYTFNQKIEYRNYIQDAINSLSKNSNIIIPSYELLLCHENKGYQELYKKQKGIKSLESFYLSSYKDIEKYTLKFPIVLKTVDGSNGKGVFLCHNKEELISKAKSLGKLTVFEKLDLFRRKYLRKQKKIADYPEYSNISDYYLYKDYIEQEKRFILQEFVPNQKYDFRVLVIFDKYFVMKRHNRDNDFRASGAKKFDCEIEYDEKLLNKAKEIFKLMDSPYLSMDFIYNENISEYSLIKFQALHFGISAITKGNGYYQYKGQWEFKEYKTKFEYELAYGLVKYIEHKYGIL